MPLLVLLGMIFSKGLGGVEYVFYLLLPAMILGFIGIEIPQYALIFSIFFYLVLGCFLGYFFYKIKERRLSKK